MPTHVVYYAGLLSGTDLGSTLEGNRWKHATWIRADSNRFGLMRLIPTPPRISQLEITLGGTGGVAGSIEGFVQSLNAAGKAYHLAGTYDTGGIITGDSYFCERLRAVLLEAT